MAKTTVEKKKPRGITTEELDVIAAMGPIFASGVNTVKARQTEVQAAKETVRVTRKRLNDSFRKLRSAVKKVAALTFTTEVK
jgi:hypothetical protein